MGERAFTPRSQRWDRRALKVAITAVVASLAIDPGAIPRKVGEVLVYAWKAVGETVVDRELTALAEMLDEDRVDLRRAEVLRDGLTVRLQALQCRRIGDGIESVSACYTKDHPRECPRTNCEVAALDGAIATLSSSIARADQYINSARRVVHARETDLCTLKALADSQRARRELARLDGVLPRWEGRAGFAAELLGPSLPAAQ
jgi:hypothetical protein